MVKVDQSQMAKNSLTEGKQIQTQNQKLTKVKWKNGKIFRRLPGQMNNQSCNQQCEEIQQHWNILHQLEVPYVNNGA